MHPVAEEIIAGLDDSVYEAVARRVLGGDATVQPDTPVWSELSVAHNDKRTLAILRVTGNATVGVSNTPWSAIVKLVDTAAEEGLAARWSDPRKEEAIYENGLFVGDGLPFRSAACYRVDRPSPNIKLFWLEDLTEARGTPFSIPELKSLLRDVGHFNGHYARAPIDLPFEPTRDGYMTRWQGAGFLARAEQTAGITDPQVLRRMHSNTPPSTAIALHDALEQLAQQSLNLPHTLSFGDCQPGNLFRLGNETVAIDWASLTMDPTGVDAGCLIGSAMTWGTGGAEVAAAERELFEVYLDGLSGAGWSGRDEEIRRGFFGQFSVYLMIVSTVSTVLGGESSMASREFLQKRFQTPLEEIPDLLVPIIDMAPKYLEEVRSLLE